MLSPVTSQMIAVGTPSDEDDSSDIRYVLKAARDIRRLMTAERIVVVKSTVPVGTCDLVRATVAGELRKRTLSKPFSVVSNLEFLKEGSAVADFMRHDRVLVGSEDEHATRVLRNLYDGLEYYAIGRAAADAEPVTLTEIPARAAA
jgi:UDPglucose 6-dehydrogenase